MSIIVPINGAWVTRVDFPIEGHEFILLPEYQFLLEEYNCRLGSSPRHERPITYSWNIFLIFNDEIQAIEFKLKYQ